jgi:hypothetical protein
MLMTGVAKGCNPIHPEIIRTHLQRVVEIDIQIVNFVTVQGADRYR